jgi:hypothetical protein
MDFKDLIDRFGKALRITPQPPAKASQPDPAPPVDEPASGNKA